MPKISYAEYIIELTFEIGICQNTELGLIETSWLEINAWSSTMRIELSNFECATIKYLSKCYVDQIRASRSDSEPPPYINKEFNRSHAADRIGNVLRGMAARMNSKRKGSANATNRS